MGLAEAAIWVAARTTHELALFAAIGIAIGGLDDLLVDLIWFARTIRRRLTIYRRHVRATAADLPHHPDRPIAVFVPAWREAGVIGPMLQTALARWRGRNVRIYVGCYPNDPATLAEVRGVAKTDARVRLVVNPLNGGTTKGQNLNAMWAALLTDEAASGQRYHAIALHDAEDVVHPAEIAIYAALCGRYALVQLPVTPLIEEGRGRWARVISAVYADEFSEAHAKTLVVRESIGAGVPAAGVGCAVARDVFDRIIARFGSAFDEASLTEDYEFGLRIKELGWRGVFVRIPARAGGEPVAVHAHFPHRFEAAIKQRARWQAGIALSGWNRLGWRGGLAEKWMRLRDRRTILSALVLLCAYLALLGWLGLALVDAAPAFSTIEILLFQAGTGFMLWRLLVRAAVVTGVYGWREGLASLPRTLIANFIAVASARRALHSYISVSRGGPLIWEKTEHNFPRMMLAE